MTDLKTGALYSIVILTVGITVGAMTMKQCSTPKITTIRDHIVTVRHDTIVKPVIKYIVRGDERPADTVTEYYQDEVNLLYSQLDSVIAENNKISDIVAEANVHGEGYDLFMQYYVRGRKFEHSITLIDTLKTSNTNTTTTTCEDSFLQSVYKYGFFVAVGSLLVTSLLSIR